MLLYPISSNGAEGEVPPLSESDQAQLRQVMQKLVALQSIDVGNCDYNYPDFKQRREALHANPTGPRLERIAKAYESLMPARPEHVDHEPTEEQCMASLKDAESLLKENTDFIERIHASLPAVLPQEKEEAEKEEEARKIMEQIQQEIEAEKRNKGEK